MWQKRGTKEFYALWVQVRWVVYLLRVTLGVTMPIHCHETKQELAQSLANYIASLIKINIQEKDECHLVLSGGNTPKQCFSLLAEKQGIDWRKVFFYLTDERHYPVDHPDRNDFMVDQVLWSKLPLSENNIKRIHTEKGVEQAAQDYHQLLKSAPMMDIVILGIGEDGHTASLFPDNIALKNIHLAVPVYHSPKAPDERVSMGMLTIQGAKKRIVLVSGSGKNDILQKIQQGKSFPVTQVGTCEWFIDKDAIGQLTLDL